MTASTGYAFSDYSPVKVPCPELDAFIADITAVLKKHGVGLGYDDGDWRRLVLVPFAQHEADIFVDNLDEYGNGIPWLDAAKTAWKEAKDQAARAQDRRNREQVEEMERRRFAAVAHQQQDMIQNGMIIDGKHYKLVPKE